MAHASFPAELFLSHLPAGGVCCVHVRLYMSSTVTVSGVVAARNCWHGYVDIPVRRVTYEKIEVFHGLLSH